MAQHSFRFDGDYSGSLTFVFSRPHMTRDYEGNLRSVNKPRYDRLVSIASASPVPTDMLAGGSANAVTLLGSGYNAAGDTPLWVFIYDTNSVVKLYVVKREIPDSNGDNFTDTTGQQFVSRDMTSNPAGKTDVLAGAIPNVAYFPYDGAVLYGSILLGCEVYTYAGSPAAWSANGFGIVRSNDQGATWQVVTDDLNLNALRGLGRAAAWMMQNWHTPGYRFTAGDGPLMKAWFCVTDYRHLLGGGGVADIFRARRLSASSGDWKTDKELTPGDYSSTTLRILTTDLVSLATLTSPSFTHIHCGGLVRKGNDLVLFLSIGDVQYYNRIVKWTLENFFPDEMIDYTNKALWLKDNEWHGSYDRDLSIDTDSDGQLGWQYVGTCQHPTDKGAMLTGGDIVAAGVAKLSIDGATSAGKAKLEHVYSVLGSTSPLLASFPFVFVLKSPSPEKAAPVIGSIQISNQRDDPLGPMWLRIILSKTGGDGQWVQIHRGDEGVGGGPVEGLVVGNTIYLGSRISAPPTALKSLVRMPVPTKIVSCRPLLVGAGGRNFVLDDFYSVGNSPHSITPITRSMASDLFEDPPGTPLDPQPPTMVNKILRVEAVERSNNPQPINEAIGVYLMDRSTATGPSQFFALNVERYRWTRVWVKDATLVPSLVRTKTTSYLWQWSDYSQPPNVSDGRRGVETVAYNRWMPLVYSQNYTLALDAAIGTNLQASQLGTPKCDLQRYYLALELASDTLDEKTPGYPLLGGNLASYPDEMATLSGFTLAADWTFLIAGMMGDSTWDKIYLRTNQVYPLCTLFGASDNYVEVRANCLFNRLDIVTKVPNQPEATASVGSWFWTRESPLLLGASYVASTRLLAITASFAGGRVQSASVTLNAAFGSALTQLRFRNATGTEVNEFRWIGGLIDDAAAMNNSALTTQLTTLAFLS